VSMEHGARSKERWVFKSPDCAAIIGESAVVEAIADEGEIVAAISMGCAGRWARSPPSCSVTVALATETKAMADKTRSKRTI
jgi:hypothetical protein